MKALFLGLVMAVGFVASSSGGEKPHRIELPRETDVFKPSELPGYPLAIASCLTCHSVEYVTYQPRSSPRAYWQATALKMQKTFGAPIPDAQLSPIVDYLAKTYGAERPIVEGKATP